MSRFLPQPVPLDWSPDERAGEAAFAAGPHLLLRDQRGLRCVELDGSERWCLAIRPPDYRAIALGHDLVAIVAGVELMIVYAASGAVVARHQLVGEVFAGAALGGGDAVLFTWDEIVFFRGGEVDVAPHPPVVAPDCASVDPLGNIWTAWHDGWAVYSRAGALLAGGPALFFGGGSPFHFTADAAWVYTSTTAGGDDELLEVELAPIATGTRPPYGVPEPFVRRRIKRRTTAPPRVASGDDVMILGFNAEPHCERSSVEAFCNGAHLWSLRRPGPIAPRVTVWDRFAVLCDDRTTAFVRLDSGHELANLAGFTPWVVDLGDQLALVDREYLWTLR